jgi:hypothetical protein
LEFEKALSAAQALAEDGARREASLQSQIDALRQASHTDELKTAVSETRCQEVEKHSHKLEQENKELRKDLIKK